MRQFAEDFAVFGARDCQLKSTAYKHPISRFNPMVCVAKLATVSCENLNNGASKAGGQFF